MPPSPQFHLAQLNLGRLVAPIDAPAIADFVAALDEVNALAEASPGFVWRMTGEANNATDIAVTDDPLLIANMSVWQSAEWLHDFVYRSAHTPFLRRRREWFEHMELFMVLWWIPAGIVPTLDDALARLNGLRAHGPTPWAFTFRERFAFDA